MTGCQLCKLKAQYTAALRRLGRYGRNPVDAHRRTVAWQPQIQRYIFLRVGEDSTCARPRKMDIAGGRRLALALWALWPGAAAGRGAAAPRRPRRRRPRAASDPERRYGGAACRPAACCDYGGCQPVTETDATTREYSGRGISTSPGTAWSVSKGSTQGDDHNSIILNGLPRLKRPSTALAIRTYRSTEGTAIAATMHMATRPAPGG